MLQTPQKSHFICIYRYTFAASLLMHCNSFLALVTRQATLNDNRTNSSREDKAAIYSFYGIKSVLFYNFFFFRRFRKVEKSDY
jgi:hypothetical protein